VREGREGRVVGIGGRRFWRGEDWSMFFNEPDGRCVRCRELEGRSRGRNVWNMVKTNASIKTVS
jgi:hypothetical protein